MESSYDEEMRLASAEYQVRTVLINEYKELLDYADELKKFLGEGGITLYGSPPLWLTYHLKEDESIKEILAKFNEFRKKSSMVFIADKIDQMEYGQGMEYLYLIQKSELDKVLKFKFRIYINISIKCTRVEDGTQPKYKIVCEKEESLVGEP